VKRVSHLRLHEELSLEMRRELLRDRRWRRRRSMLYALGTWTAILVSLPHLPSIIALPLRLL
jgi:hypothetical protein